MTAAPAEDTTPAPERGEGKQEAAQKALTQLGERRIKALALLGQAQALAEQAERELILADLSDAAGEALAEVEAAQQAASAAGEALKAPQAELERLEDELRDCRARAQSIDAVVDADADLTARIEARSLVIAFQQEDEAITARIRRQRDVLMPYQQALTEAKGKAERAALAAAAIITASEEPFTHPTAMMTGGFGVRLARIWPELLAKGEGHPGYSAARGQLFSLLRSTGIGAFIETKAIEAFRAGVPEALAAGGSSKRWDDGTMVTWEPGQPAPVVYNGRARPGDLANARTLPTGDTTPGAQVMAEQWARSGFRHETLPLGHTRA